MALSLPSSSAGRVALFAAVGVAILAVAACGASAAKPPTESELLTGVQAPTTAVPGLSWPIGTTDSPLPGMKSIKPTARECVAAWNSRAPSQTRRWIATRSARHADVTFTNFRGKVIGSGVKVADWHCAFGVAVGPRQIVFALDPQSFAAPRAVSSAWSGGLLRYSTKAAVSRLVARFNASVSRDGTLRLD